MTVDNQCGSIECNPDKHTDFPMCVFCLAKKVELLKKENQKLTTAILNLDRRTLGLQTIG